MKWSLKIGTIAGIDIYVHATFPLLLLWAGWIYWMAGNTADAVLQGVILILALFVCVVLHELGHALTARRFGIRTDDITLLPIGGVSRLERMPDKPSEELQVALAGPAVNLVIALILFAWVEVAGTPAAFTLSLAPGGSFVLQLLAANLFVALFNILPAFPMDGGRVLRALFTLRVGHLRATRVAASVGKVMALLFGLLGLFSNPFLILIAVFIWLGAAQEGNAAFIKYAFDGMRAEQAMLTEMRTLQPDDPLSRAVELIQRGWQHDFPVLDGSRIAGILTHNDILLALAAGKRSLLVGEVMQKGILSVDSSDPIESVLTKLQESHANIFPVTRNGKFAGMIGRDSLGEFLAIRAATSAPDGGRPEKKAG